MCFKVGVKGPRNGGGGGVEGKLKNDRGRYLSEHMLEMPSCASLLTNIHVYYTYVTSERNLKILKLILLLVHSFILRQSI